MSAATIDRLLRVARQATRGKKRRRVVPEIRRRVRVRTFADWHEPPPGCMEMDLVAHCGDVNRGSYVHSLVLTDIASGWTECAPLIVRESTLLVETLDRIRLGLPFSLRALDVDNGGEFLNETMIQYCLRNGIELTRSRPYRKNDQAWIEQKNGSVVRKLLGYRRFEGIAAAQALARLYGASRLFVNFFQPSFKLAEKHRQGAQVTKRYHPPETPCARLLQADTLDDPSSASYAKWRSPSIRCNCSKRCAQCRAIWWFWRTVRKSMHRLNNRILPRSWPPCRALGEPGRSARLTVWNQSRAICDRYKVLFVVTPALRVK